MTFAERITHIRKSMKLSQEKFGDLLNVSQRTVAYWEAGDRTPPYPVLIDLSEKLGVSTDYLLGLSDHQAKKEEPAITDDELRNTIMERISALPAPILSKVLDLADTILTYKANDQVSPAAPCPSDQLDP